VDLAFSAVNPSDVKARGGTRPGVSAPPFLVIIPHSDGSGVISAVGEGVSPARIGGRVWIWNGQWQRAFGTCAEEIVLHQDQAVALPEATALETGAVLGITGLTAAFTVFADGPVAGKTLLVQGGDGTVGYLAVQLAKWGGARVIATARGKDRPRALAAGADAVVDFAAADPAADILAANDGQPVDRIVEVEFGVNIDTDAAVIAENGTICAYGSALNMCPEIPYGPLSFKAVQIRLALIYILTSAERAETAKTLTRALESGALDVLIAQVFALDATAQAHEAVEAGGRIGAILVAPSQG